MSRVPGLLAVAALAAGLCAGWAGFRIGAVEWQGVAAALDGTWLWDLRWPLLPAYVVGVLWCAERAGRAVRRRPGRS